MYHPGGFETYPDRANFEDIKEVFAFQERYEEIFDKLKSVAKVLLVKSYGSGEAQKEYRGIFKALKESHILFDVVDGREEERLAALADRYEMILFAGQERLSEKVRKRLMMSNCKILATGLSFEKDPDTLKELFGILLGEEETKRGGYLLTEPKAIFSDFELRDWIYLDKRFRKILPIGEEKDICLKFSQYVWSAGKMFRTCLYG